MRPHHQRIINASPPATYITLTGGAWQIFFITVTAWALGCLVHTSRPHSRCACAHTLFVRFSTRLVSPPSLTLSSLDRRGYNIRSVLGLTLPVRSFFLMEYMTEYFTYLIQLNVMIIFQQQWGGATLDLHEGR